MSQYRIEVDRKICQGFGACVELCSDSFYLSEEDGKSKLLGGSEVNTDEGNIRDKIEVDDLGCYGQAEAACPFNAIKVIKL